MACAPARSIHFGRVSTSFIPGRGREAADLISEQARELDRHRVFAFGPDNLQSDRQSCRGQADRCGSSRQIGEAQQSGPKALVAVGDQPSVHRDQPLVAIRIVIVREGGGGGDRCQQHVKALEEVTPGITQFIAGLVGDAPGAVVERGASCQCRSKAHVVG